MKRRLGNVLEILALLSVVAMLLGALGQWSCLFDLCSHFRVQATIMLFVAALVLWYLRRLRAAGFSLVAGVVCLGLLWPFLQAVSPQQVPARTFRLLTMNVLTNNQHYQEVIDYIQRVDPDFVLLQETGHEWVAELDAALGAWPYREHRPRRNNFGIAIYSKYPWSDCQIVDFSQQFDVPSVVATFDEGPFAPATLIATHPLPPMSWVQWTDRNEAFAALAKFLEQGDTSRTIVAGDLNCTPYSYWFKKLLRDTGLRNSGLGRGFRPTWMPIPLAIFGIPIDHVLVGNQIEVYGRYVGPDLGSDHRAVTIDFY